MSETRCGLYAMALINAIKELCRSTRSTAKNLKKKLPESLQPQSAFAPVPIAAHI